MKIYHKDLLEYLPRLQLLQLHRQCCRIRTTGWENPKRTNSYIFQYGLPKFYNYHMAVIAEMASRKYKPNLKWTNIHYRGKHGDFQKWVFSGKNLDFSEYPEHNQELKAGNLAHLISLFEADLEHKKYSLVEKYRVMDLVSASA